MAGAARSRAAKHRPRGQRRRAEAPLLRWVRPGCCSAFLGFRCSARSRSPTRYATTDIPDPNKDFQAQTTFVYYADGKTEIGRFASQNRRAIPLSDVPAARAGRGRSRPRTGPSTPTRASTRRASCAPRSATRRGNATQGASTITQQYVKVLYLSQERTLSRKVKEAFLSLKIQQQKSKDEILEGYLNTIYFGRGAYGIQAAASAYFDKRPRSSPSRRARCSRRS